MKKNELREIASFTTELVGKYQLSLTPPRRPFFFFSISKKLIDVTSESSTAANYENFVFRFDNILFTSLTYITDARSHMLVKLGWLRGRNLTRDMNKPLCRILLGNQGLRSLEKNLCQFQRWTDISRAGCPLDPSSLKLQEFLSLLSPFRTSRSASRNTTLLDLLLNQGVYAALV